MQTGELISGTLPRTQAMSSGLFLCLFTGTSISNIAVMLVSVDFIVLLCGRLSTLHWSDGNDGE